MSKPIFQWRRSKFNNPETWNISFSKIFIAILNDGVERYYDNNNSIYNMTIQNFYIKLSFASESYLQNVLSLGI